MQHLGTFLNLIHSAELSNCGRFLKELQYCENSQEQMFPPVSKWLPIFPQIAAHPQNSPPSFCLCFSVTRGEHLTCVLPARAGAQASHGVNTGLIRCFSATMFQPSPADNPPPHSPPPTLAVSWVGARIKWKHFDQNSLLPFSCRHAMSLRCTFNPLRAAHWRKHKYYSPKSVMWAYMWKATPYTYLKKYW